MSAVAESTFEITGWEELSIEHNEDGPKLARIEVKKTLFGDLKGESTAERLMYVSPSTDTVSGTAYVAIEEFEGTLDGKRGSFLLQHGGLVLAAGIQQSYGHIVPGSGTDELKGLRGVVGISISEAGVHAIKLDYLFE